MQSVQFVVQNNVQTRRQSPFGKSNFTEVSFFSLSHDYVNLVTYNYPQFSQVLRSTELSVIIIFDSILHAYIHVYISNIFRFFPV